MNYSFLMETELFKGIQKEALPPLLDCLGARLKNYPKGGIIFSAGEIISKMGLILEGSVNIAVHFFWGNAQILAHVEKGEIFAEAYAALSSVELPLDVIAAQESLILFLDFHKIFTLCHQSCSSHQKIMYNLIQIGARKNMALVSRMLHIAPKTIRQKLLSYFSEKALTTGNSSFFIPFSRQELADYLGVDRSALSHEISKMQKEGLLSYKKNHFTLYESPPSFSE